MSDQPTRREALAAGSLTALALLDWLAEPGRTLPGEGPDEMLVPFLDSPRTPPMRLDWETLEEWLTPSDQVFSVQHYGTPEFDYATYRLAVDGLVERPVSLSLEQVQARPRDSVVMTLECSGNGSNPGFMNAVYNSRWTGTRLVPLLEECSLRSGVTEIAFFGRDSQEETLRAGTPRELKFEVPFGRSMSLDEVRRLDPLLAYERNGEPIEHRNGAPVRLIVPGWYGIANVKWLARIECRDRRYMGRYMARDYVTVRGERQGDDVVYVESSVTRMNLKSVVARVTRRDAVDGQVPVKAYGAAWDDGRGVARVEARVDDGPWHEATLASEPHAQHAWVFFSVDLGSLPPGRHRVVSRAIDVDGRVQPTAEEDEIALKRTYWEAYAQWPREVQLEA